MTFCFNLVEEPWIPGTSLEGTAVELGLREALVRAHELAGVAGDSPPETAALHRLLLAVVHRCAGEDGGTGPQDIDQWEGLWKRERLDARTIESYLARWRHRFDLFDDQRPFFQTAAAAVDPSKSVSIAKLLFQSDNNPTLFDHRATVDPPRVPPAQAARLVVAYQAFDTAGLITGTGDEKMAKASPLLQCAVTLVRGRNLFETLMLNLYRYSPSDGEPWDFAAAKDCPAWERDDEIRPEDRAPDGYLDLLTWQSRRIRLGPQEETDGRLVVRRATVMKGFQIRDGWPRYQRETMVAFRKRLKPPPGQEPWYPVGFQENRALWRDSLAFLESLGDQSLCPKSLTWLAKLAMQEVISSTQSLTVDALGLAADRAKLLFWRHERLTLPLPYLDEEAGRPLRQKLREAVELAETVGRLTGSGFVEISVGDKVVRLPSPFRVLAQELLGKNGAIDDLVRHLAPGRAYWASLDEPFRALLGRIPLDQSTDKDGRTLYGLEALREWREALRRAALDAFEMATHGLEQSASTMRAVSLADRELQSRLYSLVGVPAGAGPVLVGGEGV